VALDRCESCGVEIAVGAWPFCPHGAAHSAIVTDEIIGGQVFENGFDEPTVFYSKQAHREALAAQGYEVRAKWAGPNDKHLKRMDAPTEKTLRDAAVLLSRGVEARKDRQQLRAERAREFPIEVTPICL